MQARPLIGVTGPDTWLPLSWWFIAWAIRRAGGRAQRMTPHHPGDSRACAGIVISGGDDIDPGLYLPDGHDAAPMDTARDAFEVEVIREALLAGVPLLGICRGAQLINVVRGGRLHPDLRPIRRRTSNRRTPFARKTLLLEPKSRLAGILGRKRLRINSLHHQAISELGRDLRIVGRDLDDIVQAVEDPAHRFLYGVQWHPEYLPGHEAQRQLFVALVRAAA